MFSETAVREQLKLAIEFKDVALEERGFGPVSFRLPKGQLVLLCGLSGSGKSTLCNLLCQRLEASSGTVERDPDLRIGFVAHDFENQLVASTVEDELTVYSQGQNLSESLLGIVCSLEEDLASFGTHDPRTLSAAAQQILLLCSLIRSGAGVLVLDESLSHLDPPSAIELLKTIERFRSQGISFLLASHDEGLLEHVDRVLHLDRGLLVFDGAPADFEPAHREAAGFFKWPEFHQTTSERHAKEISATNSDCCLPIQSSLLIGGKSGSGKSRLLNSLFGLEELEHWKMEGLGDSRCLLRQHVGPSFWRTNVGEEWAASLAAFHPLPEEFEALLLQRLPSEWLTKRPDQLSHGQLRYTGSLCLLAQNPQVLFLDAAFRGLDGSLRNQLLECLQAFFQTGGRMVLTTHDPDLAKKLGHTVIWLDQGQTVFAGLAAEMGDW